MGQYYKFVNATKRSESTIPLPFNFNMPWAKSLERCSKEELREKFDESNSKQQLEPRG